MRLKRFLPLMLLFCAMSGAWADNSQGKYHAVRLKPGQDLKLELTRFLQEKEISACAVVTCVGSLTEARLRFADEPEGKPVEGPLEIISLVGCGGKGAWHLHLSVADREGRMSGGHLLEGCIIRTTAEIVLVELTELEFERVHDPQSGYKELEIRRR